MPEPLPPVLIDARTIEAKVRVLAAAIDRDYGEAGDLLMVGVLKGSFIFLADLARRVTVPRTVDFIALSTYREGTTAGAVRLVLDLRTDIRGRHVLVVEDIVDTGRTLAYLLKNLQAREPASLRTCALVRKPDRAETEVRLDYVGFDIPDVWVVGYGLDYGERHRVLPYIGTLSPDG